MSLSREARVLLILAVFGVGSVIVLGVMAQKYRKLIEQPALDSAVSPAGDDSFPPVAGPAGSQAEANDLIDRYLIVRRTLAETADTSIDAGKSVTESTRDRIREVRDRTLERTRLGSANYRDLRDAHERWLRGDVSVDDRFARAFADRANELKVIESRLHNSLGL